MKPFLITKISKILLSLTTILSHLESNESEKKLVGHFSSQFVENNTTIAIGTGSTVKYFIYALAKRIKEEDLKIKVVSSSNQTTKLSLEQGIEIIEPYQVNAIDLMIDGADQINTQKELIKGGGGALFREKILALAAKKLIIIGDHSKLVNHFSYKLPVEINPFLYQNTMKQIQKLGVKVQLRRSAQKIFITDNNNYIVDIDYSMIQSPISKLHDLIKQIHGVLETGYFGKFNKKIFIAHKQSVREVIS